MKTNIIKKFFLAIVFTFVGMAISYGFYAVRAAWNTTVSSGQTLTATSWNEKVNKLIDLENRLTVAENKLKQKTYYAPKSSRGTSVVIPEADIIDLCADEEGCGLDIQMIDWDGNNRVASRSEYRLHYDASTKRWRTSQIDNEGTNGQNGTEHPLYAWACYFADGAYSDWINLGDTDLNFGLLSWNTSGYVADCRLVIKE